MGLWDNACASTVALFVAQNHGVTALFQNHGVTPPELTSTTKVLDTSVAVSRVRLLCSRLFEPQGFISEDEFSTEITEADFAAARIQRKAREKSAKKVVSDRKVQKKRADEAMLVAGREREQKAMERFAALDEDDSGYLSYRELVQGLKALMVEVGVSKRPDLATIEAKFEEADSSRDKRVVRLIHSVVARVRCCPPPVLAPSRQH